MKPLLILAIVTTFVFYVQGQSSCTPPNGGRGQCIELNRCDELLALVSKPVRTQQDTELLKRSHCGFQGNTPRVCCPESCFTPNGQRGSCVDIYSCDHIASLLRPPIPQDTLTFVQNSRCNGPSQYSVCCGPPNSVPEQNTNTGPVQRPGQCQLGAPPPDPNTGCCGKESVAGNKIVGGNETSVDQYPWLTLIEYRKNNKIKTLCGGALISGRYVLTAGHCVAGVVLNYGTPANIRLGEYDTSTEGPDCVPIEGGGRDCTEGTIIIPIERTIPHPDYSPSSAQRRNDIALIRMRQTAPYTDFIRPICLPSIDIATSPSSLNNLWVAGWGATEDKSGSNIKLHVDVPFRSMDICQPAYSFNNRNVALWERQLCAGGVKGKDSCKGDSGGPLMYENVNRGNIYEVVGVVSFGTTPCGIEDIPGVYTNVYQYNSWIRSQMRN